MQVMERCTNSLQAEWLHTRAASLVANESSDVASHAEAVRLCEKVICFSKVVIEYIFTLGQAYSAYLKCCNVSGAIAVATLAQSAGPLRLV